MMPDTEPDVSMSTGTVRGRWEDGVAVYRGVPFAAPPVGPRRFAAPQAAVPWEGVRDASRFGPPPPQPGRATEGDNWLNLAVWTADPGRAKLPVVVWISGGGYVRCNSANPHLTGAAVAAAGVVLVSAHYRSGFEGLAHIDGVPDNRALLDQLAALNWVQAQAQVDVLIDGLAPTPGAHRYRAAYPAATPRQLRETALSDWLYRMPALDLAEAADLGGARVWLYELCWGFGPHGASHGLDTLLLFGTADLDGEVTAAGPAAVAATERLSRRLRADHLAFAATGDPGWARFRPPQRRTRVYRPEPVLVAYPEQRSRALWSHQRFGVLDVKMEHQNDTADFSPYPEDGSWT
jgi:carboxylesterase type B